MTWLLGLHRSEDPHDALAKQVRDMKEAVVLNNGKVEQVSRRQPHNTIQTNRRRVLLD